MGKNDAPVVKHRSLDTPYGYLDLLEEYPKEVERFADLPSGYLVIDSPTGRHVLYYRLTLKVNLGERKMGAINIHKAFGRRLEEYLAKNYPGHLKVYGKAGFRNVVDWEISPSNYKGINGTVNLIHGANTANKGYTEIELNLPRFVTCRMQRWDNETFLNFIRPEEDHFGLVEFAKKNYVFIVRVKPPMEKDPEGVLASVPHGRNIREVIKEEFVAKEIRQFMERWFPWIVDYNMLGDMTFATAADLEVLKQK